MGAVADLTASEQRLYNALAGGKTWRAVQLRTLFKLRLADLRGLPALNKKLASFGVCIEGHRGVNGGYRMVLTDGAAPTAGAPAS